MSYATVPSRSVIPRYHKHFNYGRVRTARPDVQSLPSVRKKPRAIYDGGLILYSNAQLCVQETKQSRAFFQGWEFDSCLNLLMKFDSDSKILIGTNESFCDSLSAAPAIGLQRVQTRWGNNAREQCWIQGGLWAYIPTDISYVLWVSRWLAKDVWWTVPYQIIVLKWNLILNRDLELCITLWPLTTRWRE